MVPCLASAADLPSPMAEPRRADLYRPLRPPRLRLRCRAVPALPCGTTTHPIRSSLRARDCGMTDRGYRPTLGPALRRTTSITADTSRSRPYHTIGSRLSVAARVSHVLAASLLRVDFRYSYHSHLASIRSSYISWAVRIALYTRVARTLCAPLAPVLPASALSSFPLPPPPPPPPHVASFANGVGNGGEPRALEQLL